MPIGVRDMGFSIAINLFLMIGMTSKYVKKTECPQCKSKDNLAWFDDGHAHCFSINCDYRYYPNKKTEKNFSPRIEPQPVFKKEVKLLPVTYTDLPARGITKETCELFKYGVSVFKGQQCQVATYQNSQGVDVAQHIRFANKKFVWIGDIKQVQLFGQINCRIQNTGDMYLSIFEGEIDCMAASQIFNHRFPCVSVPSGVQSAAKYLAKEYDFINRFCRSVICFDNDKAGKLGSEKALQVLPKGKAAIARLPDDINDVNDLLVAKRGDELKDILWKAQPCRTDHIINAADAWDLFSKETSKPICDYPYPELNKFTGGLFPTQMVSIAAGSGAGKSTLCGEFASHFLKSGLKVGYIALEESVQRSLMRLVSIDLNTPLHLNQHAIDKSAIKAAFDKLTGTRNLYLYNHFGSIEPDILLSQIRNLATTDGVDVVILDHISIVVSGIENNDERKSLDILSTKLRSLIEETNICLLVVTHLRRPDGKGHEEGAEVSLRDFRGSHGLVQMSDLCISLVRNQLSNSVDERSQLQMKILKSRHTGMTGEVDKLLYDAETSRLRAYPNYF